MTAVKIGLMGFGRIGRSVFRLVRDNPALDVAAIADTAPIDSLAYLLKYDTIYGRYSESIETQDGAMFVDGDRIPFLDAREPGDAPWRDFDVDIVIQATGSYRSMEMCQRHLEAGAKKVILASTPDVLGDVPLLLAGTNDDRAHSRHRCRRPRLQYLKCYCAGSGDSERSVRCQASVHDHCARDD